ncbi:hypothetical protein [Alicyclobacillus sendaiensis]|uniref:Uncharacterized protein n=1 Tax=Alicyclobacillus sendaiensis PA2 TaxID=3029425 RepID=A0ABT6Y1X9_ALISE|nr:hypothetical protein [Alicyclobacillus sendaiensis]MDI9261331.1 hypothetical protein [Alicyclobacillus sendaiensis PA2]
MDTCTCDIQYVYFFLKQIDGPYYVCFPEDEESKPKRFGSIVHCEPNGKKRVCVNFVFEDGHIKEEMTFEPVPDAIRLKLVAMLQ